MTAPRADGTPPSPFAQPTDARVRSGILRDALSWYPRPARLAARTAVAWIHAHPRIPHAAVASSWILAAAVALLLPEPQMHAYHHAFNEFWYTSVLQGEIVDGTMPPGYVELARPFAWILPDAAALRLVSLLAVGLLVATVAGAWGASSAWLVASLPWLLVWGTRAQTDAAMVGVAFAGIAMTRLREPHWSRDLMGGLLVGLSAFIKPVGLVGAAAFLRRPVALLGVAIGSLFFVGWVLATPGYWSFHLNHGEPFEDLPNLLVLLPFIVGGTWLLWRGDWVQDRGLLVVAALAGAFAVYKAPTGHAYYALPALVALALAMRPTRPVLGVVLLLNVACGLFLWGLALWV